MRHLLEMSELPNVTFRVIPFGQASFPGSGQSVDYVMEPVPQLDTVLLDTHQGSEFLDSEPELAGRVHLRESDAPGVVLTTGADQFRALLGALRQQSAGGRR